MTVEARQPAPPGELVIDTALERRGECAGACRRVHSWTADGRRICWRGSAGGVAIDAETTDAAVPPALARRWPMPREEFWVAWTRAEVHAKLWGVPILAWLERVGLDVPDGSAVSTWTRRVGDLTITLGQRRQGSEADR